MSRGVTEQRLRQRLYGIDPYEFEHLVADVYDAQGYETEVSRAQADGGIDVIATQSDVTDRKTVIQAKRYSEGNKVGAPHVRQYAGVRQREIDADEIVIVTTSEFTRGAKEEARELNVKLIDGAAFADLIEETGLAHLVEEYTPEPEDSEPDESSSTESTADSTAPARSGDTYYTLVFLSMCVQGIALVAMFEPAFLPVLTVSMAETLFALTWLASPVVTFADAHELHAVDAPHKPNRVTWPIAALMLPVLGLLLYSTKRSQN